MNISFAKYHGLENTFLVIPADRLRLSRAQWSKLAVAICHPNRGIGADGILVLSKSRKADRKMDIFNADGSWAEKSGNGLRIAALHLARLSKRPAPVSFEVAGTINAVRPSERRKLPQFTAEIGAPDFVAKRIPVKSRLYTIINSPVVVDGRRHRMTCLSVGNPHAIILVDTFKFAWQELGARIEKAPVFPNATNVEFVRVVSRKKMEVAEWERGAGPTGSSGTGAAAAVAAGVMLGLVDRRCEVVFRPGSLHVHWNAKTNIIELTGPAEFIGEGEFLWTR